MTTPASRDPRNYPRVRIYQLLPRLFSNTNENRKPNGTVAENGVGKFSEINTAALASLKAMHFTHLWLTGVLRQVTSTNYSAIGEPADDPDLLKGLAGSPYAIRDYFDICPDYADNPANRMSEFRDLLERIHAAGLKVIIDFVPNHVARSYCSTNRPELSFGLHDDRSKFFHPQNNFFYLQSDSPGGGPPLRLPTFVNGKVVSPTCQIVGGCDGLYAGELDHAKVTGNNAVTWTPGFYDWYETIKLNYGYDFTTGAREYPHAHAPNNPVPDTWFKMDAVLTFWQEIGVDGFRCDMAHMVPPEFWTWLVARVRARQPNVFLAAEAYDNDPAKCAGCEDDPRVMRQLLRAGFDTVYDDPSYKILKRIYDGPGWANDLDREIDDFLFRRSLRYSENHDEVRLAGAREWGGIGMDVGRPVSAILYGLSQGPVLLYSGQEVGEPANGAEGFGGDDARTSIFDYWSMPELTRWVNDHRYDGGRLTHAQKQLRAFYGRLLGLINEPAFRNGEFYPLNPANVLNEKYGRMPGETASGHWLYSFLRHDAESGHAFLVVANLHRSQTFREIELTIPPDIATRLNIFGSCRERLCHPALPPAVIGASDGGAKSACIPAIPALSAGYFELSNLRARIVETTRLPRSD